MKNTGVVTDIYNIDILIFNSTHKKVLHAAVTFLNI
jgi:hypothetical protein